jgi:transposase, IS5 family
MQEISYFYKNSCKMVGKIEKNPQLSFFHTPLIQFIDLKHPLCILANKIDWEKVEKDFSIYYKDFGRPSVPIRKMVGLMILKHEKNLSDETIVEMWKENPYWQYFCGETTFQTNGPFDPSEFVHFRKRIGEEGAEKILKISILLFGKEAIEDEVLVDTTVQEKNITFPTDTKLQKKIIEKVVKIARKEGILLRQTYTRTLPQLMIEQRFRNHPKRRKKANAAARKIKTIAGRVLRDIQRKMTPVQKSYYSSDIEIFDKVLSQQRHTPNKIYSLHEPHVKCIAKGKESKQYEFGNKSSIVKTKNSGIVVGAMAFEENLYDGDILPAQLDQVMRTTSYRPKVAIGDRGFRGRAQVNGTQIVIPRPLPKSASKYQKYKTRQRFRKRAGIEPIIGHIKQDHRMLRNYLKGAEGDKVNTILAAAAFNFRKMLNRILKSMKNNFLQIFNFLFFDFENPIFLNFQKI